jgi:hypothetical protein
LPPIRNPSFFVLAMISCCTRAVVEGEKRREKAKKMYV